MYSLYQYFFNVLSAVSNLDCYILSKKEITQHELHGVVTFNFA